MRRWAVTCQLGGENPCSQCIAPLPPCSDALLPCPVLPPPTLPPASTIHPGPPTLASFPSLLPCLLAQHCSLPLQKPRAAPAPAPLPCPQFFKVVASAASQLHPKFRDTFFFSPVVTTNRACVHPSSRNHPSTTARQRNSFQSIGCFDNLSTCHCFWSRPRLFDKTTFCAPFSQVSRCCCWPLPPCPCPFSQHLGPRRATTYS